MTALFWKELRDNRRVFVLVCAVLVTTWLASPQHARATWLPVATLALAFLTCYQGARALSLGSASGVDAAILMIPISGARLWLVRMGAGLLLALPLFAAALLVLEKSAKLLEPDNVALTLGLALLGYMAGALFSLVSGSAGVGTLLAIVTLMLGISVHLIVLEGWRETAIPWSVSALYVGLWSLELAVASLWVMLRADLIDGRSRLRLGIRAGLAAALCSLLAGIGYLALAGEVAPLAVVWRDKGVPAAVPAREREVARPWARIDARTARFWFPVNPARRSWTWNRPDMPEDQLEYKWLVELSLPPHSLEVGYTRWKSGSAAASGALPDLLAAGQTNVWENRRASLDMGRLTSTATPRGVLITIEDPRLVTLIHKHRPARVVFASSIVGVESTREAVPVSYEYE